MSKYYFSDQDEEKCYTINAHKQQMKECGETERTVYEAERSTEKNYFFCNAIGEVGAKPPEGDPCGKECIMYIPRNGISGCCTSYRRLHEQSDRSKLIKI